MRAPATYLVTGSQGFVGGALTAELCDLGATVIGVDIAADRSQLAQLPGVSVVQGRTADIEAIWREHNLPRPDLVFHLGEYSRIARSFDDLEEVWTSNVLGTKAVMDFCLARDCPLIYTGTSSHWGDHGASGSPYTWFKSQNVELLRNYWAWYGLKYAVAHLSCVYGPGQPEAGASASVVGIFERAFRAGRPIPVVRPGTQRRRFTHIADTVEGLLLLADGFEPGLEVAFAGDDEVSIDELARLYDCGIEYLPARRGDRLTSDLPPEVGIRAEQLGWIQKYKLADYISESTRTAA